MDYLMNNNSENKQLFPLGLALSGGSVKGFAHLGVFKYLEENGIRPDIIAGTSAGSLMGAFYADGFHPEEIAEMLGKLSFRSMTNFTFERGGFFDATTFSKLIKNNLRHKYIEDLEIPMRIVATDIDNGKEVVFTKGLLADCILASCSIPVLLKPVLINGVHYVDGGLFRNFPVSTIRDDCKTLIGVNLSSSQINSYKKNIVGISQRSIDIVFRQNSLYEKSLCDIILESNDLKDYGMFDFASSLEIANIGYKMAKLTLSSHIEYIKTSLINK